MYHNMAYCCTGVCVADISGDRDSVAHSTVCDSRRDEVRVPC